MPAAPTPSAVAVGLRQSQAVTRGALSNFRLPSSTTVMASSGRCERMSHSPWSASPGCRDFLIEIDLMAVKNW